MITSVTGRTRTAYLNAVNKEISLSLMGDSEYACRPIEGLGPVKADISTIDLPLEPGGLETSSQDGQRNLVLTVEFKPEYSLDSTVTELRQRLYDVWTPRNKVEMDFTDHLGQVFRIKGVVETHEPNIFTKDPTVQISILCAKPYFKNVNEPTKTVAIPINGPQIFAVDFEGRVEWGFDLDLEILEPPTNKFITIEQLPRENANFFELKYDFLTGDKLHFSTVQGRREVTLTRGGVAKNMLGYFSGSLVDVRLRNGLNHFRFPNIDFSKNIKFSYEKVYGGL